MNPADRRLLLELLDAEEREGRPLSSLLDQLAADKDRAALARFLAIKEKEERARQAVLDHERWFRSFSWRLMGALFAFGVLGLGIFVAWGGEAAFSGALFFIAGGASFYLVAQAMTAWRGHKDRKALTIIRARCLQEMQELRGSLKG